MYCTGKWHALMDWFRGSRRSFCVSYLPLLTSNLHCPPSEASLSGCDAHQPEQGIQHMARLHYSSGKAVRWVPAASEVLQQQDAFCATGQVWTSFLRSLTKKIVRCLL